VVEREEQRRVAAARVSRRKRAQGTLRERACARARCRRPVRYGTVTACSWPASARQRSRASGRERRRMRTGRTATQQDWRCAASEKNRPRGRGVPSLGSDATKHSAAGRPPRRQHCWPRRRSVCAVAAAARCESTRAAPEIQHHDAPAGRERTEAGEGAEAGRLGAEGKRRARTLLPCRCLLDRRRQNSAHGPRRVLRAAPPSLSPVRLCSFSRLAAPAAASAPYSTLRICLRWALFISASLPARRLLASSERDATAPRRDASSRGWRAGAGGKAHVRSARVARRRQRA
jgi:hypothetical protein